MSANASARPIEFRNTTLGATVALLQAAEPTTLADALHKMLGGMPDFFNGEAVILDFGAVPSLPERIDWAGLQSLLRRYRLQPIGIVRLPDAHHESARRAGLALIDPAQLAAQRPSQTAPKPTAPLPRPPPPPKCARPSRRTAPRPSRAPPPCSSTGRYARASRSMRAAPTWCCSEA